MRIAAIWRYPVKSMVLRAHPQTLVAGKATCCAMHANLDAPL